MAKQDLEERGREDRVETIHTLIRRGQCVGTTLELRQLTDRLHNDHRPSAQILTLRRY
jgi:hypothetical protein